MTPEEPAPAESPGNENRSPQVIVSFSDYKPPFDPVPIVRRMLDSVPKKYLLGLHSVVLSNTSGMSGKRRNAKVKSRKRKFGIAMTIGLYHSASRGSPAWIEIFVDNALRDWDTGKMRWLGKIPYIRETALSDVLFHEIGHHIHRAIRPEHREKEDVADVWKGRLVRNYNRERRRWVCVVARLVRPLFGAFLERQRTKLLLEQLKSGQISRAEYLERAAKTRTWKLDVS